MSRAVPASSPSCAWAPPARARCSGAPPRARSGPRRLVARRGRRRPGGPGCAPARRSCARGPSWVHLGVERMPHRDLSTVASARTIASQASRSRSSAYASIALVPRTASGAVRLPVSEVLPTRHRSALTTARAFALQELPESEHRRIYARVPGWPGGAQRRCCREESVPGPIGACHQMSMRFTRVIGTWITWRLHRFLPRCVGWSTSRRETCPPEQRDRRAQ